MFFEPICIPRALNTGTCVRQGDLFYSAALHRNYVLATTNTGEIGRGFKKNAGEWTGRVEISKEEIPGSKCSICGYILTYSRHSTRELSSSRVTSFTLRAYTGTGVSHSQYRKKIRRGFGKIASEWTVRVEISKEEIPGSKRSMYGYILTCCRL